MRVWPLYPLFVGALLLAGCAGLRQPWQAPAVSLPEQWSQASSASTDLVPHAHTWWRNYGDAQLDALVERALRVNNDFSAAAMRVRRAQLQAELVNGNLTPTVSVRADSSASRTFDPVTNYRSSGTSTVLSYEVDLWGKLASRRDAAHWEAEATAADCRAYGLSLIGSTTRLYWQLAYQNRLLTLNDGDIDYAEKTLALARVKHSAGGAPALNVAQAELELANQRAARTALLQRRVETRNALAILLDRAPGTPVPELADLSDMPVPPVAAGLPAAILANRPDLRSAELRLRASFANIDVTRTSFYPTLSLTGTLSTASVALTDLLRNPVATLGAGLTLPFVQWKTMRLSIRVSESQYEEAVVHYRQRLLTALAEVENSLSARQQLLAEEEQLRLALTQARRAERIAAVRFKSGYTDMQQWLYAQAALRAMERALAVNRLNQLNNSATLYRSLGLGAGSDQIVCR
jgi:NodT family efflux transporter outer membrane factor (OMF) lipoprotein